MYLTKKIIPKKYSKDGYQYSELISNEYLAFYKQSKNGKAVAHYLIAWVDVDKDNLCELIKSCSESIKNRIQTDIQGEKS